MVQVSLPLPRCFSKLTLWAFKGRLSVKFSPIVPLPSLLLLLLVLLFPYSPRECGCRVVDESFWVVGLGERLDVFFFGEVLVGRLGVLRDKILPPLFKQIPCNSSLQFGMLNLS
jgi:hypothetical protein